MNTSFKILTLAAMCAIPLGGCVSVGEYDAAKLAANTQASRNEQLQQELEQNKAAMEAKQRRIEDLEKSNRDMLAMTDEMKKQLDAMGLTLDEYGHKLNGFNLAQLDPATDSELRALAAQYPDLMSYDGTRGMIRLNADLTFDSGSDAVKDSARSALGQLAKVLGDTNAGKYDIRLVGHTDNVQISNPATKKRFGSNRALSLYRSMAVEQTLAGYGVAPNRMETSGWGEYMPAVDNNPKGGTRENRRVEIFLVPSQGMKTTGSASAEGTPLGGDAAPAPAKAPKSAPSKKDIPFK